MPVLADILIRGSLAAGPAGDVIWRNANLGSVDFAGVRPTPAFVDEFLALADLGQTAEDFARLLPDRSQVGKLVRHRSPLVRKGVTRNCLVSREELDVLAADAHADVASSAAAELARRVNRTDTAASGDVAAAVGLLQEALVEEIADLLERSPEVLAAAVASSDTGIDRIAVLDVSLLSRIGMTVLADQRCLVPAAVASWACSTSPEAETALDAALSAGRHDLRRRCTPTAFKILAGAGHLNAPSPVQPVRSHVRLDDMAFVLETFELAGLFFSSQDEVSEELRQRIFEESPVSMVVNHLIGQTPRRPGRGEVFAMLADLSPARRTELSLALEDVVDKAASSGVDDPTGGFPWSGELLLCLRRARAAALPSGSASELLETIDSMIDGDELAWEYLLALSDEWEGALIDLVVSAANMEGISA